MIKNYSAVATLIRNRLNDENKTYTEKLHWFHEKGVSLQVQDDDLYTLKTEKDGHRSELIEICQRGLIYRGRRLSCFMGERMPKIPIGEVSEFSGISLNSDTLLIQKVEGRSVYMFHDSKTNDWEFADDKHTQSSYQKTFRKYLYNIMMVDTAYTYFFEFVESGKDKGIFLIDLIQTKTGKRKDLFKLQNHAMRLKVRVPEIYKFEGIESIENEDLPLIVQDSLMRRVEIIS